jgi:signal transduction histidine kinase
VIFQDDNLVTVVEDTGVGIKNNDLNKLFKFFGKLTNTSKINRGGMGLGLTISKMIVEQMNGKISVTSEYGKGSRFAFYFKFKD